FEESIILKTVNGGVEWIDITSPVSENIFKVLFTNDLTGYAFGGGFQWGQAFILKTTDGGNQWNIIAYPATDMLNDAFFTDDSTGYAIGFSGLVMKTTDAGNTWWDLSLDLGDITSIFFINDSTGYVAGYGGSVYKTIDSGTTWVPKNLNTSNRFFSIFFQNDLTGFMVGEGGTILKMEGGSITNSEDPFSKKSNESNYISIYPNPVAEETTFSFHLDKQLMKEAEITILNNLGGNVYVIKPSNQNSLGNTFTWDKGDLPAGIYYLILKTKNETLTEKFIIL
ncbi:MAG: T9SS type A sorting domain-containing protein, partial [Bacteroidetes bacterium]|nr:T9SS type A sorting domain-containing protein [Bacteroidota bacterium]